ncbi:hypothetical protein [Streptomyces pseudovenezuelae]|uniref:Uncharacterized protein n=1 Tax=Streptomyces pseudovenezuelae TaxID=67350 RepID=A0ABZ1X3B8_9ACTN|nr:hypothetical protein [Streptomyces pseudovenezuelae]
MAAGADDTHPQLRDEPRRSRSRPVSEGTPHGTPYDDAPPPPPDTLTR